MSVLLDLLKRLSPTFLMVSLICFLLLQDVASDWAVEAMPTFMFLKNGKIIDKVVGAKKEELQQTIAKHMTPTTATA